MNNSIYELVKSHCVIFDKNLQNVKLPVLPGKTVDGIFQLDYLQWYPDPLRIERYGLPGDIKDLGVKDNPNWVPSGFDDVYIKSQYFGQNLSIDYQLVIPGKSPVAILNRWFFKVREGDEYVWKWRISVYGKALKLYYMGYISRLENYIIKYNGTCCRADLCWDFPCDFPSGIVDMKITGTNHGTVYMGEKNSSIFFRKYDKTKDLRHEKNCFAWLYPEWYQKECRRLEAQISGRYSRSMTPLDWLDIMQVDKSKIEKQELLNRNVYKTALYSVINTIDWVNLSLNEKLDILINSKKLLESKITKLRKEIF